MVVACKSQNLPFCIKLTLFSDPITYLTTPTVHCTVVVHALRSISSTAPRYYIEMVPPLRRKMEQAAAIRLGMCLTCVLSWQQQNKDPCWNSPLNIVAQSGTQHGCSRVIEN